MNCRNNSLNRTTWRIQRGFLEISVTIYEVNWLATLSVEEISIIFFSNFVFHLSSIIHWQHLFSLHFLCSHSTMNHPQSHFQTQPQFGPKKQKKNLVCSLLNYYFFCWFSVLVRPSSRRIVDFEIELKQKTLKMNPLKIHSTHSHSQRKQRNQRIYRRQQNSTRNM